MSNLTQVQIDALVALVKKFPLLAAFGADELGPLSSPPQVEGDIETYDMMLYETEKDVQGSFIVKNNVKVTIKTRNIDMAMKLLEDFKKGDNIFAPDRKQILTLVPITDDETAKTISLTDAFLQPGLSYTPGDAEAHEAQLVFICRANAETGKPFTYGAA